MVMPPVTLVPSSSGVVTPRPSTNHAPTSTTTATRIPHRPARAGRPVRSACDRRMRTTTRPAMIATPTATAARQLAPSYQMALAPRTLTTAIGPSTHDSFGRGKAFWTTPMYSSTSSTSSGTLRTNST